MVEYYRYLTDPWPRGEIQNERESEKEKIENERESRRQRERERNGTKKL